MKTKQRVGKKNTAASCLLPQKLFFFFGKQRDWQSKWEKKHRKERKVEGWTGHIKWARNQKKWGSEHGEKEGKPCRREEGASCQSRTGKLQVFSGASKKNDCAARQRGRGERGESWGIRRSKGGERENLELSEDIGFVKQALVMACVGACEPRVLAPSLVYVCVSEGGAEISDLKRKSGKQGKCADSCCTARSVTGRAQNLKFSFSEHEFSDFCFSPLKSMGCVWWSGWIQMREEDKSGALGYCFWLLQWFLFLREVVKLNQ